MIPLNLDYMQTVNQKTRPIGRVKTRAFTLIELLVVISIIVLLVGLMATWFIGASARQGRRSTQSAMASLLTVADMLKNKSAVLPDHRLANYMWIQPHQNAGLPLWSANPTARQMSSMEFFVFLSSMNPDTQKIVQSISSNNLKESAVPSGWGAVPSTGFLVDIFMQYPGASGVFDKDALGQPSPALPASSYALMSGVDGYPLRSIYDTWGNELIYRFSTDKTELNMADGTYAKVPASSGTYTIKEKITRDEQVTYDRYVVLGQPVVAGVEYVRPAVSAFPYPAFASPGKDGLWGSFQSVGDSAGTGDVVRDALDPDSHARDAKAKDNIYSQEENH